MKKERGQEEEIGKGAEKENGEETKERKNRTGDGKREWGISGN